MALIILSPILYKKKYWKAPMKMGKIRRKEPHRPKPEEHGDMP
jgi:hypothetical protein